jgi:type IV conjugative transfer system coupling protein TraD
MSVFRNSAVGDFTRGGQTTIHFVRMVWQITKKFFKICLVFYFISACLIFYYTTSEDERYYSLKYGEAYLLGEVFKSPAVTTNIKYSNGIEGKTSYASILNSKPVIKKVEQVLVKMILSFGVSLFAALVLGMLIVRFIYTTGRSQAGDDFIRGNEIVDLKKLNKVIKQFNKTKNKGLSSGITIAGAELPFKFDKSHVLLIGSTGTGKSVNFREALASIRRQGKKAIVYDVAGNFIKHFYRKDKDIILNPMDVRSAYWDIWCDCKTEADFIALGEALMPDGYRKDFFDIAAKMVFSSIAYQLGQQPNPNIKKLMDLILKVDFETIATMVKNTDAASILNNEAGRMAASVRGVMAANTRALKFLREDGVRFSITDWVQGSDDSWVFVSCNDKQIDMLRPIITAWFDIFFSNVLSLSEDEHRRIYAHIDEFPSVGKLSSAINGLAQGRKYGLSAFIGLQNHSQLVESYGKHGADAICDLCSTWLVFRANSKEGARWAAENIGNRESIETNEGLSFGINDIRDGVSVNKHRIERLLVSPTEIMNLPDLTGFLKLGRGFPVAKFMSKYKNYSVLAEPFIPRSNNNEPTPDESEPIGIDNENDIRDGKAIEHNKRQLDSDKEKLKKHNEKSVELFLDEMEL